MSKIIIVPVLVPLLMALTLPASASNSSSESLSLLREAYLEDPRSGGADAFRLSGTITTERDGRVIPVGKYSLLWISPVEWREEISSAELHQVRIGGDGGIWQTRQPAYLTLPMWQLIQATNFYARFTLRPNENPSKIKLKKREGSQLRCISTRWKDIELRELCFDQNAPELVWEEYKPAKRSYEFLDYSPVGSRKIPKRVRVYEGKDFVVELSIETIEIVKASTSSWAQKPADAQWINRCPNPKPAQYIGPTMGAAYLSYVIVYGSIGTDGRWHDLRILKSDNSAAKDAAFLQQMAEERYRPAECNGVPVAVEIVSR